MAAAWQRITAAGRLIYWNRQLPDGHRITASPQPDGQWRWKVHYRQPGTSGAWTLLRAGDARSARAAKQEAALSAGLPVRRCAEGLPVCHVAGYRDHTVARSTGTLVILADAAEHVADPEEEGGRWFLICDPHAGCLNHPDRQGAEYLMRHPEEWCPHCQEARA